MSELKENSPSVNKFDYKTGFWVLSSVISMVAYSLYDKNQENERMYGICSDQEVVIKDLEKAISLQTFYIKQLEYDNAQFYNPLNNSDHDFKRID